MRATYVGDCGLLALLHLLFTYNIACAPKKEEKNMAGKKTKKAEPSQTTLVDSRLSDQKTAIQEELRDYMRARREVEGYCADTLDAQEHLKGCEADCEFRDNRSRLRGGQTYDEIRLRSKANTDLEAALARVTEASQKCDDALSFMASKRITIMTGVKALSGTLALPWDFVCPVLHNLLIQH